MIPGGLPALHQSYDASRDRLRYVERGKAHGQPDRGKRQAADRQPETLENHVTRTNQHLTLMQIDRLCVFQLITGLHAGPQPEGRMLTGGDDIRRLWLACQQRGYQ